MSPESTLSGLNLFVTDGTVDANGSSRVLRVAANGVATPFATVPGFAGAIVAAVPEPPTVAALALLGISLAVLRGTPVLGRPRRAIRTAASPGSNVKLMAMGI